MWEEVIKVAVSNGIFAVLFCSLLVYELRITGKRESKYQKVIEGLTQSLSALKNVEQDLESVERLIAGLIGVQTGGDECYECAQKIKGAVRDEAA